jgi:hypothetical protein
MLTIFKKPYLKREIIIRTLKIIDIFYATFIYIFGAFIFSFFLDKYVFGEFDEEKENKKNLFILVFEVCGIVGFTGVISYLFRNLAQAYLFPFEGYYGFSHIKVMEVKSGALFTTYILLLNSYLQKKIVLIKNKFMNLNKKPINEIKTEIKDKIYNLEHHIKKSYNTPS